jgi:hypothetical protein
MAGAAGTATFYFTSAAAGAAIGAGTAYVTGGDVGRGALFGAVTGAATAGVSSAGGQGGLWSSGGWLSGGAEATVGAVATTEGVAAEGLAGATGDGFFSTLGTNIAKGVSDLGFKEGVGLALIGAGGIQKAGAQIEASEIEAGLKDFQIEDKQQVASFNSLVNARDVREFNRSGSALAGARRAVSAASGIRGSTGQALSVTTELQDEIQFQAALIAEGGDLETGALLKESEFLTAQRASLLAGGRFARTATLLDTAGRLFA